MTFHQQVNFIHQRIFNEDYHTFIQNRYQQEQQDSYFKKIEEAYQRGIEHLEHALDNIRRRELAEIESRYAKQHSIVSELSFCSGLCMSFEHYFHRNDQACGNRYEGLPRRCGNFIGIRSAVSNLRKCLHF